MKRPMPRPESRRKPAPVIRHTPHPQVWATALHLAGHDVRRIQRLDDAAVIVLNVPSV